MASEKWTFDDDDDDDIGGTDADEPIVEDAESVDAMLEDVAAWRSDEDIVLLAFAASSKSGSLLSVKSSSGEFL